MSETHPNPWDTQFSVEDNWNGWYDSIETSDLELYADPPHLAQCIMVQPQQWWREEGDAVRGIPQSLLYEIPLVMRAAEVKLAGFEVEINFPYVLELNKSSDQLSSFETVTKDMNSFTFRMMNYSQTMNRGEPLSEPEGLEGFYTYLCAAMGPHNVPDLSLGLGDMTDIYTYQGLRPHYIFLSTIYWSVCYLLSLPTAL